MGFMGTCCTYCCAVTGGFGVLFLATFAIALKLHAYFIPEVLLLHQGDEAYINAEYDSKALGFAAGAVVELVVLAASLGCLFLQRRKARARRADAGAREEEARRHREAVVRRLKGGAGEEAETGAGAGAEAGAGEEGENTGAGEVE